MPADAKATAAEDAPAAAPAAAKASKPPSMMGMMLATVVISTAASGGIAWFLSSRAAPHAAPEGAEEKVEVEKKAPAEYLPLNPAFVVNLEDEGVTRFLQVDIELMSRQVKAVDDVKAQEPRIRNALLLLLGQQKASNLVTREGKEKLQADALAAVQLIMTEETGEPKVEGLYFTSFVMQ